MDGTVIFLRDKLFKLRTTVPEHHLLLFELDKHSQTYPRQGRRTQSNQRCIYMERESAGCHISKYDRMLIFMQHTLGLQNKDLFQRF